jgi:hypothetical protein
MNKNFFFQLNSERFLREFQVILTEKRCGARAPCPHGGRIGKAGR